MKHIALCLMGAVLLSFMTACNTITPETSQPVSTTTQAPATSAIRTIITTTQSSTTGKGTIALQTKGTTTSKAHSTSGKKQSTTTAPTTSTKPQYNSVLGGLRLSILGDSLSSYHGYSNVDTNNTTLSSPEKGPGMESFLSSVYQTYWMQVIQDHEMSLLVNNSWPGSLMRGVGSRAVNLHANTGVLAGTKPDVIAIFMGTNDLFWSEAGEYRSTMESELVTKLSNGLVSYREETTFAEGYFIAMHKIASTYPEAKIFCFTLHPNKGCDNKKVEQFNAVIKAVADHFDAPVVDLYNSNLSATDTYLADSLHLNANGMTVVADLFEAALLRAYAE